MNDWLNAVVEDQPAVLVTVAIVEGSGPRAAGTHMLVTAGGQCDTIGGGHLEMRAIDIARAMLRSGAGVRFERFALGPTLGQCCGGVVHLVFEALDDNLLAVLGGLRQRHRIDSWRVSAIDGAASTGLYDADGAPLAGFDAGAPRPGRRRLATHVLQDGAGRRWLLDYCPAPRAHLTLFGAGHVGTAIVRALADLPCHVTWVDERADLFPASVPANVTIEASDVPEALVASAPSGGSFLVMTHSHALDQRLTEAILSRPDAGWFGLIGSQTKRKQFEHRLLARGVDPARVAAMVCPIGLAGISDKAPAAIAASVTCQLLMVWEAAQAAAQTHAPPLRLVAS